MKHTKRNQLHSWLKDCEPIMSYLSDVELEVLTAEPNRIRAVKLTRMATDQTDNGSGAR